MEKVNELSRNCRCKDHPNSTLRYEWDDVYLPKNNKRNIRGTVKNNETICCSECKKILKYIHR